MVKNPPAMQETLVRSLGQEDTLEKEMATHCLEGHAQPLGLAYLPSSVFSLHITVGPPGPLISKQASRQGPSAISLLMPFILPGTPTILPSKSCLSQILSFLGSLEVSEKGLKVL